MSVPSGVPGGSTSPRGTVLESFRVSGGVIFLLRLAWPLSPRKGLSN